MFRIMYLTIGIVSSSFIIFFILSNLINTQLLPNETKNSNLNAMDYSQNTTETFENRLPNETLIEEIDIK